MKKPTHRLQKVKAESLGLDVHQGVTAYCLLDRKGEETTSGKIRGGREALEALLKQLVGRKRTHISLEASGGSLWVYDLLVERYGKERVHIAHARKIAAIANSREKNDDNDAFWLAYLTQEGRLPESYVPEGEYRELRVATRERVRAVRTHSLELRRLKCHFRQMGVEAPVKDLSCEQGAAFVREIAEKTEGSRGVALRMTVRRLEEISVELAGWNRLIAELARDLPEVALIAESIPGMGAVLAATVVAETGPITRFHSAKALAKFTGLTPTDRSTGGATIHGGISREGSPALRWALTQAVTICGRMRSGAGDAVRVWVDSRHRRMGSRAKAKVAAANKMSQSIWRLVNKPQGFDAARPFGGVSTRRSVA